MTDRHRFGQGSDSPASTEAGKRKNAERLVMHEFQKARRTAQSQIEKGRYHDALFTLSIFYHSPDLDEEERRELVDILDALAAKVVYSPEHHLARPHRVGLPRSRRPGPSLLVRSR